MTEINDCIVCCKYNDNYILLDQLVTALLDVTDVNCIAGMTLWRLWSLAGSEQMKE